MFGEQSVNMRPNWTFIKNADNMEIEALMKSCRLCMSNDMEMKEIFESYDIDEKILFCTRIQVTKDDNLPSKICVKCVNDLQVVHNFIITSCEADETLRMLINSNDRKPVLFNENGNNYDQNYELDVSCDIDDDKSNIIKMNEEVKIKTEVSPSLQENNVVVKKIGPKSQSTNKPNLVSRSKSKPDQPRSKSKPGVCRLKNSAPRVGFRGVSKTNSNSNSVQVPSTSKPTVHGLRAQKPTRRIVGSTNSKREPKKRNSSVKEEPRCIQCDITFNNRQEEKRHIILVHKAECKVMCEICGKWLAYYSGYYDHIRSHQSPNYECDHCEYKTANKCSLRRHMDIHMDVKRYLCSYCPRMFRTASNRVAHVRRAHLRLKPYACHVCGKAFSETGYLKDHVDTHNQVKRYVCDICHSQFAKRYNWKKHMASIHGIKVPQQKSGRKTTNFVAPATDKND